MVWGWQECSTNNFVTKNVNQMPLFVVPKQPETAGILEQP
jgi:hypothetical protein